MTNVYINFTDATETTIADYLGGPQDPASFKFQGMVGTDDPRWKTFYDSLPASVSQYLPTPDGE